MKSIGSSSKMLREAIGERITGKTHSAKHKFLKEFKNTKDALGSLSNDTKLTTSKKFKNVRSKLDNFSLRRPKHKRSFSVEDDERPQTISLGNNEMLQSLTFNSPLNNRSYNLENIPSEVSNYEIPKSLNRSSGDLPTYEDVVSEKDYLKRNTNLTQSLYSIVHKPNNLDKGRNISDTRLNTISSESSSDENESAPPNCPAPELSEMIYGRIKKLPSTDYENAPMIPLRKPPPIPTSLKSTTPHTLNESSDDSDMATVCGSTDRSYPDLSSIKSLSKSSAVDRSESWRYVDNISHDTVESLESTEPIYANDENERIGGEEAMYSHMFEAKTTLLTPQKVSNVESSERKSQSVARDILNEFDPLSRESFDAFIMNNMNHLSLLETLLSEETYGTIEENLTEPNDEQMEEDSSADSIDVPSPPERSDSIAYTEVKASIPLRPAPVAPQRTKKVESRAASVIIHQNLNLKDSVENLAEPFLAQANDNQPSTSKVADLSRPKQPQTSWFVEPESDKFKKNNLDNPNNFAHATADKITKTIPKVNNIMANREHLPTYEESKNDEIVNIGVLEKTHRSIFDRLKRKSSLKESKLELKDFISRPPFAEDPRRSGDKSVILFKLPSGVIEDILKELNPRFVEVKNRQFKAFSDSELKVLKEHLDFSYLSSIQFLVNHKFTEFKTESGRQIFCFEINLAVPKNSSNALPVKTQRLTYVYGIHSKNEK